MGLPGDEEREAVIYERLVEENAIASEVVAPVPSHLGEGFRV